MLDFCVSEINKQYALNVFCLGNIVNSKNHLLFFKLNKNQLFTLGTILQKSNDWQKDDTIPDLLNDYCSNYKQQQRLLIEYGFADLIRPLLPNFLSSVLPDAVKEQDNQINLDDESLDIQCLAKEQTTSSGALVKDSQNTQVFNYEKIGQNQKHYGNMHININGKPLTRDTFNKRYYVYEGTQQPVTLPEKNRAEFHDDGTIWVDGRKIIWNQKNAICKKTKFININGRQITRAAFNRRHYYYDDTQQPVTRSEKNRAVFCDDGTVRVDGRKIIWNQKNGFYLSKQILFIDGKEITRDAFNRRHYVYEDTQQSVTVPEKKQAEFRDDGTIWVDGRKIIWEKKQSSQASQNKRKLKNPNNFFHKRQQLSSEQLNSVPRSGNTPECSSFSSQETNATSFFSKAPPPSPMHLNEELMIEADFLDFQHNPINSDGFFSSLCSINRTANESFDISSEYFDQLS